MSSQIFFKDGGSGLSSVKYTCAGDRIFASAAGYGSVVAAEGYGNGDGSVAASAVGYGSVAAAYVRGSTPISGHCEKSNLVLQTYRNPSSK